MKEVAQTQSQRIYTQNGKEFLKNYDMNKGLLNRGDIAHDVNAKKTSDVLNKNYKADWEISKNKTEFEKNLGEVNGIKHTLETSKNVIDASGKVKNRRSVVHFKFEKNGERSNNRIFYYFSSKLPPFFIKIFFIS